MRNNVVMIITQWYMVLADRILVSMFSFFRFNSYLGFLFRFF